MQLTVTGVSAEGLLFYKIKKKNLLQLTSSFPENYNVSLRVQTPLINTSPVLPVENHLQGSEKNNSTFHAS